MSFQLKLRKKNFENKNYAQTISGLFFGECRKICRRKHKQLKSLKLSKVSEDAFSILVVAEIEKSKQQGTPENVIRADVEKQIENLINIKSHQPTQQEIFIRRQGVTTTHPAKSSYNSNTEVLEHSDPELLGCERLTNELIAVLEKLKTTRKVKPPVKDKDQAHNFVKREIYLQQLGEKASEIATWVRRCKDCQG